MRKLISLLLVMCLSIGVLFAETKYLVSRSDLQVLKDITAKIEQQNANPPVFKKGDIVRLKKNPIIRDVVKSVPGDAEYDRVNYISHVEGFILESNSWEWQEKWELDK